MINNDYLASVIDKYADLINEYRLRDIQSALYDDPDIAQFAVLDIMNDLVNLMLEEEPDDVFSKGLPYIFKHIDCPNHVTVDLRGVDGTCGIVQSKLRNGLTVYCDELPFAFLSDTLVYGKINIVGAKSIVPSSMYIHRDSDVDIYLPKSLTSLRVMVLPWQAHINVYYEGTCEELDAIVRDKGRLKNHLIGHITCSDGIWEFQ